MMLFLAQSKGLSAPHRPAGEQLFSGVALNTMPFMSNIDMGMTDAYMQYSGFREHLKLRKWNEEEISAQYKPQNESSSFFMARCLENL